MWRCLQSVDLSLGTEKRLTRNRRPFFYAGILLGVERKHYRYREFCEQGTEVPIFTSKSATFGVVICLDTNYFEPSRICALQRASLLLVPMCNKVQPDHVYAKKPLYYSHLVARAHENRCWVVAADWVWPNDGIETCPGHRVAYDLNGHEVVRSRSYEEDWLVVGISRQQLSLPKGLRLHGSMVLWGKIKKLIP